MNPPALRPKSARPKAGTVRSAKAAEAVALGALPEWDLSALYPAMDSAEFAADLAGGEAACKEFAEAFRGKLEELVKGPEPSAALAAAVKRYEEIEDLLGRVMSYAGLVYTGDTTDPKRAKFYGDTQERLTAASSELLFFTLELNRIDDKLLDAAAAHAPLAHWRPWLEDIRKDKPFQLDDKLEQLFHEKSVTGRSAWNRLFDETMASLRFEVDGEELTLEPTLNKFQDADEGVRRRAADALAKVFRANLRALHADHQHARQGQGDFRPLARLPGRCRFPPSRQPRRARGGRRIGGSGARRLSALVTPLLRAESQVVRQGEARTLGPQRAACRKSSSAPSAGTRRATPCCRPMAPSRPRWRPSRSASSTSAGSTRRSGPARRLAPSRTRQCRRRILIVLLNYQGKPRDVMTLAHELGHGVHQVLAAPNGALMAPTPLTLAETASRVRRDADLPPSLGRDPRCEPAQGDARRQGRGHDQHGRAADRLLHVRAQAPHRAAEGRADRATS